MRYLFLCAFGLLAVASLVTVLTEPQMQSKVPIIYWCTDPNPAREEQIRLFHAWLRANGHVTKDGQPICELRLDTASNVNAKQLIQGVSGVASDIIDCDVRGFQSMGLLADVTDEAQELGFGLSSTYPSVEPALFAQGRQYGFPCNVNSMAFWVNVDTFIKYGMDPPPRSWDFKTFETVGKEFVARANPPGKRQEVFFTDSWYTWSGQPIRQCMYRSLGLDTFNETLTRCMLDDKRYVRVLALIHKWTYEDHLMPSAADQASFSTQAGYGGMQLPLFQHGNYAMISTGRWCLIRIREFAHRPQLSVSHYPFGEFPNAPLAARIAGVYAGSKHKDLACLFLAYLASQPYNECIVKSADGLPPNPAFTRQESYRHPNRYENEWGAHEVPVEAAETIAVVSTPSPFVADASVLLYQEEAFDLVMSNLATPEEAARGTAEKINREIERTVADSIPLQAKYASAAALQKKIDAARAQGERVPLEKIENPFHRRYYAYKGWALEE